MRVNHALGLLALLCCAALASGQSSAAPQVLLQGRFGGDNQQLQHGSLPLIFSWPSSSAFVSFQGTAVNVSLAALPATFPYSQTNRFRFEIDSEVAATETTDLDSASIEWGASGLTSGPHNLTITKLNEAAFGEATLQSITLDSDGKFLTPATPAVLQSGRRMQIIGDSFASGFANIGDMGVDSCSDSNCAPSFDCSPDATSQDATLAWGPLTAQSFEADHQLIAWSGVGAVTYDSAIVAEEAEPEYADLIPDWVEAAQIPLTSELFTRQVAGDNTSTIQDYSVWVPQIVVMAGGGNDFLLNSPPELDSWRSTYLAFIQNVSDIYNQPSIILLTYPMESSFDGNLTPEQTEYYLQYMTSLYVETQMQSMTNVYLLQLNGVDFPTDNWCDGHPNVAAHANMAQQLTKYIQAVLPHWAKSTYPSVSVS